MNYLPNFFSYAVTCYMKNIRRVTALENQPWATWIKAIECAAIHIHTDVFYFTDVNEVFCSQKKQVSCGPSFWNHPFSIIYSQAVSVAVGLHLSHHLNFSNELLMRGQLLMEIRKTFIEELYWVKCATS